MSPRPHSLAVMAVLCLSPSLAHSQSKMEFQTGTNIEVTTGADICADTITINGTCSISGTRCGSMVSVESKTLAPTPTEFSMDQNFPNPFNPTTAIRYGLPQRAAVSLSVYNTLGQKVATLVNEDQEAGYHEVRFDGTGLASGVYFYRLQAGSFVETKKLLLIH